MKRLCIFCGCLLVIALAAGLGCSSKKSEKAPAKPAAQGAATTPGRIVQQARDMSDKMVTPKRGFCIVCGKAVDFQHAVDIGDTTYQFDSDACMELFRADPDKYIKRASMP
jgi:YHS domain-containing protein